MRDLESLERALRAHLADEPWCDVLPGERGDERKPARLEVVVDPDAVERLGRALHRFGTAHDAPLVQVQVGGPEPGRFVLSAFGDRIAPGFLVVSSRTGADSPGSPSESASSGEPSARAPAGRGRSRRLRPSGLWIAVLGLDGSGKSTVTERVVRDLAPAFVGTRRYHLRPRVGLAPGGGGPVTDPHAEPARNLFLSVLKIPYWWLDFVVGYTVQIRPLLRRGVLVAFDRYFHDLLVDPIRFRYGGPAGLPRVASRCIPLPDLVFLLDAPAGVLRDRKAELPLREAERQRGRFLALARSLENAFVVDAARPVAEVAARIEEVALSRMAGRMAGRFASPRAKRFQR